MHNGTLNLRHFGVRIRLIHPLRKCIGKWSRREKMVKGILQFEGNLSVRENGMQIETVEMRDPMEVVDADDEISE
jgi:hypothetical protein